jgi:hypothetical protein
LTVAGRARHRIGDQLVERLLLFDDAQDRTQLAQVLKLGLIEQVLRAARNDRRRCVGAGRVANAATSVATSDPGKAASRTYGLHVRRCDRASSSRSARVEPVREAGQIVGRDAFVLEGRLGRDAQRRHDDRQPARSESQISWMCRNVCESRCGATTNATLARKLPEQAGRLLDHVVEFAAGRAELVLDPALILGAAAAVRAASAGRRRCGSRRPRGRGRPRCGAARGSPAASSSAISLRIVAELTPRLYFWVSVFEPTGSAVATYS